MLRLLLGVLLLALAPVISAAQDVQPDELYQADDDTPQGQGYVDVEPVATPEPAPLPTIFPYFNGGLASQAAVSRSVGRVRYKIISCPPLVGQLSYEDATHVRATLGKSVGQSITERPAVANTIMAGAAQFAWKECPQPFFFLLEPRDEFHYNVRHVEIVDAEGNTLLSGQLGGYGLDGYGDQALGPSRKGYKWQNVRDVLTENNAAAARDLVEQQAQEERIAARQQADTEAQAARQSFFDLWKTILILAMFSFGCSATSKRSLHFSTASYRTLRRLLSVTQLTVANRSMAKRTRQSIARISPIPSKTPCGCGRRANSPKGCVHTRLQWRRSQPSMSRRYGSGLSRMLRLFARTMSF